jgi:hypothetical protein
MTLESTRSCQKGNAPYRGCKAPQRSSILRVTSGVKNFANNASRGRGKGSRGSWDGRRWRGIY